MKKIIIPSIILIAVVAGLYFWIQNEVPENKTAEEAQEQQNTVQPQFFEGNGFSFSYPSGFNAQSQSQEEIEVITVETESGEKGGFQISVMPFDEEGPITAERIKEDLPDADIKDEANADADGTQVLTYFGNDETLGDTFEAWFVKGGKLYQIVGYKESEGIVKEALRTWKWVR